jgi:hypothetical protein
MIEQELFPSEIVTFPKNQAREYQEMNFLYLNQFLLIFFFSAIGHQDLSTIGTKEQSTIVTVTTDLLL